MRTVLLQLIARWRSPQICLDERTSLPCGSVDRNDESRLVKCNAVLLREVQRLNAQLHNLSERHAELSRNYSAVLADNLKLRLEVNNDRRRRSEHAV